MRFGSSVTPIDVRVIAQQQCRDDAIRRAAEAEAIRQSDEYFGRSRDRSWSVLRAVGSLLIRVGTALHEARVPVTSRRTNVPIH